MTLSHNSVLAVVGAGLGGLRTVEHLRRWGYAGKVVMLGAEAHLPYDRPPLSKKVLSGEVDVPWLRADNDLSALDIDVRPGHPALALDLGRRVLVTEHEEVGFDALVIATGATARRIPGLGGLALRTLDDARVLRAALTDGARLAIVGAGLVGCEVAASARKLGVSVDLIDVLDGPLIRVVGAKVADAVAQLHREHGVRLHLGSTATRSGAERLLLSDGGEVGVDVVLEAIGAVPDTAWLEGSGLDLGDGVLCDEEGRAADGIYAVGDVARWGGVRAEHWTRAGEQAAHVAALLTGHESSAATVPYWWSDQYELKIQGLGHPAPDDDVRMLTWGPKARLVALYSRAGRLTGVVGFSAAGAVVRLRGDIIAGTSVDEVAERLTG